MASTPIIELADIDLTQVLVGPTSLDKYLKQAGRFRMLEGVLYEDVDSGILIGFRDIREDDWWAKDHIPGRPLFPGALQIEAAAQLASYDYSAHRLDPAELDTKFVGFGGVENARFRGTVEPGCRLHLVSHLVKSSRRMFRYKTQGVVDGRMVFEAEILGVVF